MVKFSKFPIKWHSLPPFKNEGFDKIIDENYSGISHSQTVVFNLGISIRVSILAVPFIFKASFLYVVWGYLYAEFTGRS